MNTENFYAELERFSEFDRLSDDANFEEVPAGWYLVLSDVAGSTSAIAAGRYQDVNMLGASTIAAVQGIFGETEFPFVFGGDGATFLIPSSKLNDITLELSRLKSFAQSQYEMDLRVGVISVADIRKANQVLQIAKYELSRGKSIAMFRGGGMSWAENQIKTAPHRYCLTTDVTAKVDGLQGLSCRWQPIPSNQGMMLSILVQPKEMSSLSSLGVIMKELADIFGGSIEHGNPVRIPKMTYKGILRNLRDEFRLHEKRFTKKYLKRAFGVFVSACAIKLKIPNKFLPLDYIDQIPSHSDFRKFDDTLRLVVDATNEQRDAIKTCLERHHKEDAIFYGIHESTHALMTCLVGKPTQGGHIHFIDGSDGGYALAAKSMKEQIKAAKPQLAG